MSLNIEKTLFQIPKMDCPSEEKLIRMALENIEESYKLEFNLQNRTLILFHTGAKEVFLKALVPLKLGASITESSSTTVDDDFWQSSSEKDETNVLKILLLINGVMFVAEIILGLIAESTGLIADSVDMFADAAVYSLSLYAVGHSVAKQKNAAKVSGYLQLILALGAAFEVIRRFIFGSEPEPYFMIGVAIVALIANVACMILLAKHRDGGVHMKASWIFSTNDVIANAGVIIAGILVAVTASRIPDLVIGGIIALVVFRGALQILRLSRPSVKSQTLTTMEE